MNNSIRWLLTEAKISNLNPDKVNFINGKLICYHLTSHKKWATYSPRVKEKLENPTFEGEKQERSADDSRAIRILKNLKDKNRVSVTNTYDIEEEVIMDMVDDPYTDTSGFSAGAGDYHGKGLYTCYKFNPKIARTYGEICLVFEIDISNFIITFKDLAQQVHGKDWKIKDQLIKLYKRKARTQDSLDSFIKLIDDAGINKLKQNKSIENLKPTTSSVSLELMDCLGDLMSSVYDGIIFIGGNDGPVCVSFYPKYDARIIGLGRLSTRHESADVDWYDSLNDFIGGTARNKLDFETMNDIADSNKSLEEKIEMKENERDHFDAAHMYMINQFNRIQRGGSSGAVSQLASIYEEIDLDALNTFYALILNNNFVNTWRIENSSFDELKSLVNILENMMKSYKSNNQLEKMSDTFKQIALSLKKLAGIAFSDEFLVKGVYPSTLRLFKEESSFRLAKKFLDGAKHYISSTNNSKEFANLIEDLESKYGLDLKIRGGSWLEVIELYKNSDQTVKDKIADLPSDKLFDHTLYPKLVPDYKGSATELNHHRSKDIVDGFCNVVDAMIRKNNVEVLGPLQSAIEHSEHKLSDLIIDKAIEELFTLPEYQANEEIFALLLSNHIEKFEFNDTVLIKKLKKRMDQINHNIDQRFNNIIKRLQLGEIGQSYLSFNSIYYSRPVLKYFNSQPKEWHYNLIKLIIENTRSNSKFAILKHSTLKTISYFIDAKDVMLNQQEQKELVNAAGKNAHFLLEYKHIDPNVFLSAMSKVFKNKNKQAQNSAAFSKNFYKFLYQDKKFLELFVSHSINSLFTTVLLYVMKVLKDDEQKVNVGTALGLTTESLSNTINVNDNEWLNYFLQVIRVKTNSGKTKRATKHFKELESLIAIKSVNQDIDEPDLDSSHRKTLGGSLKQAFSFFNK